MKLAGWTGWQTVWILTAIGCGPSLVPVEGTVTLGGQPLAGATVTIQRDAPAPAERSFRGETDQSGRYQLRTADGQSAGALPGEYRVYVTSVKAPPNLDEFTKLPSDPVPQPWRDGSQSFTVPDGGTREADFAISSSTRR